MHFSVFNQFFCHHPHKVIFCTSQFNGEAQIWWKLAARELRENANGDQQYLTYANFKAAVKRQLWKDLDMDIKYTQWEKLCQANFPDSDLFFQKFKSLAFEAGVLSAMST